MDLRRRSKNRVVEAMARIVALLPTGQEPARTNCDIDIYRVDSVPEGCNESVKPRSPAGAVLRRVVRTPLRELHEPGVRRTTSEFCVRWNHSSEAAASSTLP
jgi:hypothetical protein